MKIKITKRQEIVNDTPEDVKYTVRADHTLRSCTPYINDYVRNLCDFTMTKDELKQLREELNKLEL